MHVRFELLTALIKICSKVIRHITCNGLQYLPSHHVTFRTLLEPWQIGLCPTGKVCDLDSLVVGHKLTSNKPVLRG